MTNTLFLTCSTDGLESVITKKFPEKSYFFNTLGNSFNVDTETFKSIISLLVQKNIGEICFVLSEENDIILDAIGSQNYRNIRGLGILYKDIVTQYNRAKVWSQYQEGILVLLSYYLNKKVDFLKQELNIIYGGTIDINAKIYSAETNNFRNVFSPLLCQEVFHLN